MKQDTLLSQRGECLKAIVYFENEDGSRIDITDKMLSISSASHAGLYEAQFEYINAVEGTASLYIPAATMALIPYGRSSWFRIACEDPAAPDPPGEGGGGGELIGEAYAVLQGGGSQPKFFNFRVMGEIPSTTFSNATSGAFCEEISLEGVTVDDITFVEATVWDVPDAPEVGVCREMYDYAAGTVSSESVVESATITLDGEVIVISFDGSDDFPGWEFDCYLDITVGGEIFRIHFQPDHSGS